MAKGKVLIEVLADVGKAKGAIDGLAGKVKGIGEAVAAGAAAAGAAVVGVGAAALSAYKDYEQLVGGVDTLFGAASGRLQQYAADAYRTAGMSANQYMQQATSFSASLISSVGGDTAHAADLANVAMTSMADNVNKMGSSMTDVQNAYQGFAKQNYSMLDNLKLGYGGTQEEMRRLIDDANKLREANGQAGDLTIDKFGDVVQAIDEVQRHMGIAGATAEEAMGTIEGSVNMAQAAWGNWLAGLGRSDADMGELTDQLLEAVGAVAENVAPRVAKIGQAILENLPGALSGIADTLGPIISEALAGAWNGAVAFLGSLGIELPEMDAEDITGAIDGIKGALQDFADVAGPIVTTVINVAADAVKVLADNIDIVVPVVAGLAAAFLAVAAAQGVIQIITALGVAIGFIASPIGIVVVAIAAVVAAIVALMTNAGGCRDFIMAVISAVGAAISGFAAGVVQFFTVDVPGAITSLGEWFMGLGATIGGALLGAITAVGGFVTDMASKALEAGSGFISNIGSGLANLASSVGGKLSEAIGRVASWATDMATKATNAARDFKDKLLDGFANAGSWLIDSGKAILDGLGQGISDAVKGVTDIASGAVEKIRSFFPFSPAKRGPFSGRGYTTFSGRALMGGFAEGIDSGTGTALDAVAEAVGAVQEAFDISMSGPELAFSATGPTGPRDTASPIVDAIRALTERVDAMEYNLGPIIARNAPRFPSDRDMQRMVTGYVAGY
ncbi:MAG: hypothetical protein E7001_03075 [Coriobacteriaceae bacterium]|nr:hypothetical protein [Coriobacteriaceae bacterium]